MNNFYVLTTQQQQTFSILFVLVVSSVFMILYWIRVLKPHMDEKYKESQRALSPKIPLKSEEDDYVKQGQKAGMADESKPTPTYFDGGEYPM